MQTLAKRMGRPSLYADARGSIRTAALGLFAERGFDSTSFGDVAVLAGVPKANVLYYFPTKDALWKEAIDAQWQEVDAFYEARRLFVIPATREGLAMFVATYLEACRRFPPYVQIPNLEGHADTWRTRWIAERYLRRHIELMHKYQRRLIEACVIPEMDSVIFQTILAGGGQLLIGQYQLWRIAIGSEDSVEDFIQSHVAGLMRLLDRDNTDRSAK